MTDEELKDIVSNFVRWWPMRTNIAFNIFNPDYNKPGHINSKYLNY